MSGRPFPPDEPPPLPEGTGLPMFASPTERLAFLPEEERESVCPDCHALEGEVHHYPCDCEICPLCHQQLTVCGCLELPEVGMDLAELERAEAARLARLEEVGRIPWIAFFLRCARCGCGDPDVGGPFVDRGEWDRYVQPDQRRRWLCEACWERIRRVTDLRSATRFR